MNDSRRFLLAIFPGLIHAVYANPAAPSPENEFADAYNEWARLMNHTPEGTIDARATRQWARVKRCWRELEKSVGYNSEQRE